MKKILHVMSDHAYKRVYASFMPIEGVNQILAAPPPAVTTNIVTESYVDCGIKDVRIFRSATDLQRIIDAVQPNAYTQADLAALHSRIRLPKGCKRVMLAHGIMAKRMYHVVKKIGTVDDMYKNWSGFDLYCLANDAHRYWLNNIGISDNSKIVLDTLTQLDLARDSSYYNKFRDGVIKASRVSNPSKIILFFGNRAGDRYDYLPFNKDYFDLLFELSDLAEKNNWLVLVKPKSALKKMTAILKAYEQKWGWPKEYISKYISIQNKKNLFFISTNTHPYGYFFADVIVTSGSGSTVEVDAAAAKKPIVVYRPDKIGWEDPFWYDPADSIQNNAVLLAKSTGEIKDCINNATSDRSLPDRQSLYLKNINLTNDGKAYIRALNAIKGIL